jgi:hypothetical protein
LTATGTMTVAAANTVTFAGTAGFTVGNYTCTAAGRTTTFVAGVTYTVTGIPTVAGTNASKQNWVSSSPGTKYNFIHSFTGGTQDIGFLNVTDANSNGGKTLNTYKGTITTCNNWRTLPTEVQTKTRSY